MKSNLDRDIERYGKRSRSLKATVIFVLLCAFFGIAGGGLYWALSDLPRVNAIEEYVPAESSKVYSEDGKLLAEFYFERRTFIPYYNIPDHVKKAFVSIEDIRFYSHPGVDIIGIMRALWQDIRAGGLVQGGSTITQQLAKMLFLKPEKSVKRKLREAVLSIQIERTYTKDEIIGLYLNQTYFGTRAFGIEAAAQTYFGKSVGDLTIGDAALLASLPKAPSLYSPFRNPGKAKDRRSTVLQAMIRNGFITKEQYDEAMKEPLPEAPHYRKYEAPYFIEFLRHQLEQKYGTDIYTSGMKIYCTINSELQQLSERSLAEGIRSVEKRVKPGVQASLIAVDIRTGHIRAMVGGFDFWQNQFNRATQALRQPGSAFKPFVYVTAIENGMSSKDVIIDSPPTFKGAKPGQTWTPKNYDGKYYGSVTMKTALAKSLNAATVRLAAKTGIDNIIATAKRLGIRSDLQPYMPLALGASDVTLMEMVSAYSVFATGKKAELIPYIRVENRDGIVIDEQFPKYTDALDEQTVSEMKVLLGAVVQEGTAVRAKSIGRPVFGKTGTTNDCTDAWFIGFDDRTVLGVWVGRDDHTPIGKKETGASAALPIWIGVMKETGQKDQQP